MTEHERREVSDIVGQDEVAALEEREPLCRVDEREAGARRRTEIDLGVAARERDEAEDVIEDSRSPASPTAGCPSR